MSPETRPRPTPTSPICPNRGVLFGLGASVYDGKDPFGWLFLQALATVAESEGDLGTPARA
ncbi:hypothetical protein [Amycolatopsis rhizosphaerae]|uniref:hypothetical protein n=1 Tax=Amycolatopsis rhizosphaerae TaxID=2053003 RepID=UPI001643A232|nr:hypothetical protein [Amycolatopsis rhizosphaerae]